MTMPFVAFVSLSNRAPTGVCFSAVWGRSSVGVNSNPILLADFNTKQQQQQKQMQQQEQKEGKILTNAIAVAERHWHQKRYLEYHQSVQKRKAMQRLLEIVVVLCTHLWRPLISRSMQDIHRTVATALATAVTTTRQDGMQTIRKEQNITLLEQLLNSKRLDEALASLGPTFVKLGQVMATRPDIVRVPIAEALINLPDSLPPFDNKIARRIIRRDINAQRQPNPYLKTKSDYESFFDSLSNRPIAAGSMAQVYKGMLPGFGPVAVKVQRPGIRKKVERDATLFHSVATWLEGLRWPRGTPFAGEPLLGYMQIVQTVDEFTSRVFEDMDFEREAQNMQLFAAMYCHKRGLSNSVSVVVPQLIPELCSSRVIVMEWIEGTKLTDVVSPEGNADAVIQENLALVTKAIECTLSQLLTTGIVHAGKNPHRFGCPILLAAVDLNQFLFLLFCFLLFFLLQIRMLEIFSK